MLGNVWEWVWDYDAGPKFHPEPVTIPKEPVTDPIGPTEGPRHLVRGHSWKTAGSLLKRKCYAPERKAKDVGFRVARTIL